jgi:UDP-2,4-diacetamido-2,4,6-trideoxy-beta-L-altropyranose hydrolase
MRCLALAHALRETGAETVLVTARGDWTASHCLRDSATTVHWIEDTDDMTEDARLTMATFGSRRIDWVVADHYRLDATWHDAVRNATGARIMAIDDLADRPLSADLLLDANRDAPGAEAYRTWLRRAPRWLLGPRHALLAPAYRKPRRYEPGDSRARSIGVFTGGADPSVASVQILEACRRAASFDGPIEIATTRANPRLELLQAACREADATLTIDAPDLAAFFAPRPADRRRRRRRMGALPRRRAVELARAGRKPAGGDLLARARGRRARRLHADAGNTGRPPPLTNVLRSLADSSLRRQILADRAVALVDGRGAHRVAASLSCDTLSLRPATSDNAMRLHTWRNHPTTRAVCSDPAPIPIDVHLRWFERTLADHDRRLWIGRLGDLDVGSIHFNRNGGSAAEVSLYLDPALIGLGLGERLLAAGEDAAADWLGVPTDVIARIVPGNDASVRLFARAGYLGEPTRVVRRIVPGTRTNPCIDCSASSPPLTLVCERPTGTPNNTETHR